MTTNFVPPDIYLLGLRYITIILRRFYIVDRKRSIKSTVTAIAFIQLNTWVRWIVLCNRQQFVLSIAHLLACTSSFPRKQGATSSSPTRARDGKGTLDCAAASAAAFAAAGLASGSGSPSLSKDEAAPPPGPIPLQKKVSWISME